MVSSLSLIPKSSCPSINTLLTTKCTSSFWYPRHFLISEFFFFSSLARSLYLSQFSFFFLFFFSSFTLWSTRTIKSTIQQVLFFFFFFFFFFFLLTITWSGRLAEIRWFVFISKSPRILCGLFFRTDSGLCIYRLFVWSDLNFLHNSLPTQTCLVLYPFFVLIYSIRL